MEKYINLGSSFIKKHYYPYLLLSLFLCILSGGIMSFRNLEQAQAAIAMERYVSLIGIILLPPLFVPEQDKEIWRLEQSKAFSLPRLYLLRIFIAVAILLLFISSFIGILGWQSVGLEIGRLWLGSICEILFLGSLGFFVSGVTNQVILGYMVSILYYMVNIGGSNKLGIFGLFQMSKGRYDFWPYMLTAFFILLLGGILIREGRSRRKN